MIDTCCFELPEKLPCIAQLIAVLPWMVILYKCISEIYMPKILNSKVNFLLIIIQQ